MSNTANVVTRTSSASAYRELNVGETILFATADGAQKMVRLESFDDRSVTVRANTSFVRIPLGHFRATTDVLPPGEILNVVEVDGLRVGAEVTKAFMKGTKYSLSLVNLHKDARLYIVEAGQPMSPGGTHVFPLPNYEWNFADNWLNQVPYGWHLGIDMNADRGHSIVSITNGTVVAIRDYDSKREQEDYWGNNLALLGDDGILYCYMHWDRLADGIGEGGRLKAGELIGPVGRSGFETKPFPSHLHLEMMVLRHPELFYFAYELEPEVLPTPNRFLQPEVEGHVINPYPYLVEWYLASSLSGPHVGTG